MQVSDSSKIVLTILAARSIEENEATLAGSPGDGFEKKKKNVSASCEIEDFIEAHLCYRYIAVRDNSIACAIRGVYVLVKDV